MKILVGAGPDESFDPNRIQKGQFVKKVIFGCSTPSYQRIDYFLAFVEWPKFEDEFGDIRLAY